jgi:hypothetical protein
LNIIDASRTFWNVPEGTRSVRNIPKHTRRHSNMLYALVPFGMFQKAQDAFVMFEKAV